MYSNYTPTRGTAYCNGCNKDVEVRLEDWGIGAYEFWGERRVQEDLVYICNECGQVVEGEVF